LADEPFIVVSDESGTDQRIQSLAFISGRRSKIQALNTQVRELLAQHQASELKFKNIDDNRISRASREVIRKVITQDELRVLVLTWDMQDERHAIEQRDATANFHRMIFHGLRRNADWHGQRTWDWYPDQKTDLDHESLKSYLNCTREDKAYLRHSHLFDINRNFLTFRIVKQVCSKEVPIVGVADLFAGMVRHSIIDGESCILALRERHLSENPILLPEFDSSVDLVSRTKSEKARFIADFYNQCVKARLGVSLKTHRRLATFAGNRKFAFWHYEPQGAFDRAPQKSRRLK
jgi:hypothetical protein